MNNRELAPTHHRTARGARVATPCGDHILLLPRYYFTEPLSLGDSCYTLSSDIYS